MSDRINAVIAEHVPLARRAVESARIPSEIDRADLFSSALQALHRFTLAHAEIPGNDFARMASPRVRHAIIDRIRTIGPFTRRHSLRVQYVAYDEEHHRATTDTGRSAMEAREAAAQRATLIGRVRRKIQRLPRRDRQILALYYFEGLTMREIGAALGVTESRISQ
jgi:RNA polymerase sigma factor (sigma-70 family)